MNAIVVLPISLGLLAGYLINYLADVLPIGLKLTKPTCKNLECKTLIEWKDYLLFKRCTKCRKKPSFRIFIVLLSMVAMSVFIWYSPPVKLGFVGGFFLFSYLFLVGLIDFETRLILRFLSIIGIILCLCAGLLTRTWQETFLGAVAGFGIMIFFYLLGMVFTHWRNKQLGNTQDGEEALGSGDVTLATMLGLLLGWPLIWFDLLMGILIAGIFCLFLILGLVLTKKYQSMMIFIAYGPFFIVVAILLIYFPVAISSLLPAT